MKRDSADRYQIQALVRGLKIFETFLEAPGPVRLTEVATTLRLDKSLLFRYCATLQALGYLVVDPKTKAYRLGPRVHELGYAVLARMDALRNVRGWLPSIAQRFGGTASFAVLSGSSVVYIDRAFTQGSLSYAISIGGRLPAIQSSIGKVLLAHLPDDERRRVLAEVPAVTRRAFEAEARETRRRGFALNLGGLRPGLNSVAVVVREPISGQIIGGLNVAGEAVLLPRQRLVAEIAPALLEIARKMPHNESTPGM